MIKLITFNGKDFKEYSPYYEQLIFSCNKEIYEIVFYLN